MAQEEQFSQRLPDTCPISDSSQALPISQSNTEAPWGRLYPIKANFRPLELTKNEYTVGRSPGCDLELPKDIGDRVFGAISKVHFRIKRNQVSNDDFVVYLEDLSFNGTFINGRKVGKGKSVVLESNDQISMSFHNFKVFIFISSNLDSETKNYPEEVRLKYAISRVLGSGACGVVKLVFEKSTGKAFAMKVVQKKRFRNEMNPDIYQPERTQREVEILKALSHVFVIRFENVIDSPDHLFILTEYVEGGELFDRLRSRNLREVEVKMYFFQLALAIQYLHGEGIIHRDVKLENILLSSNDSESLIKLSDFGLSKFLDSESMMMTFCGTPLYIAPEILKMKGKAGTYDKQVDIWSMGVVLYACLSGTFPFSQNNRKTLTEQVLGGHYGFPRTLWWHVSRKGINLVKRMLTVDPKKRITIDGILNHPWLKDKGLMMRISRLLAKCNSSRQAVIERENSDEEEEEEEEIVSAKRPKLEEIYNCGL